MQFRFLKYRQYSRTEQYEAIQPEQGLQHRTITTGERQLIQTLCNPDTVMEFIWEQDHEPDSESDDDLPPAFV